MSGQDPATPGWDAITAAMGRLYPGQVPKHYGTVIKHRLGGPDPIDGFDAWKRLEPVPHWHIVTYGFSELYEKESDDAEVSGYGFELTIRPTCDPAEEEPPMWALNLLQNLARYVFSTGNVFKDGDWMPAHGPIARDEQTALRSLAFASDPELPPIDTPFGGVAFIQVVGLTEDEERAARMWKTAHLLEAFRPHLPLLVTDLARGSLLCEAEVQAAVTAGTARDGSSTGYLFAGDLAWRERQGAPGYDVAITAAQAGDLAMLLPLRVPHGRVLRLVGDDARILFEPAEEDGVAVEDGALVVRLVADSARALADRLAGQAGGFSLAPLPIAWTVTA